MSLHFLDTEQGISTIEYIFEIFNRTPIYLIRSNFLNPFISKSGHLCLNLKPDNEKDTTRPYQHDLIAKQWLYNDDVEHKIQVDHINRDRLDNHIYNLRWTTRSENNSNKKGYKGDIYKFEYALTYNVIMIKGYYEREINNLYKMDGEYYVLNDRNKLYERMLKRVDENKKQCLNVYDVNDKFVRIYLNDE